MWIGAALGCYVDPKLIPISDDEAVEVFVQKTDAGISPLLIRNGKLLMVVMPMKLDGGIGEQLDRMRLDRLRRRRKMTVVKPKQKAAPVPWWATLLKRKAA